MQDLGPAERFLDVLQDKSGHALPLHRTERQAVDDPALKQEDDDD